MLNLYITLRALLQDLEARKDDEEGLATVEYIAIGAGIIVLALAVVAVVDGRVTQWIADFAGA